MSEIKIITLWQPWASFVALGLKHYETRSWLTFYRGKLAIHAAKRPLDDEALKLTWRVEKLAGQKLNPVDFKYPLGCIVAIADLTECFPITALPASPIELAVGDWRIGLERHAWQLENICSLAEPIECPGNQGLRRIEDAALLSAIDRQIRGGRP